MLLTFVESGDTSLLEALISWASKGMTPRTPMSIFAGKKPYCIIFYYYYCRPRAGDIEPFFT